MATEFLCEGEFGGAVIPFTVTAESIADARLLSLNWVAERNAEAPELVARIVSVRTVGGAGKAAVAGDMKSRLAAEGARLRGCRDRGEDTFPPEPEIDVAVRQVAAGVRSVQAAKEGVRLRLLARQESLDGHDRLVAEARSAVAESEAVLVAARRQLSKLERAARLVG